MTHTLTQARVPQWNTAAALAGVLGQSGVLHRIANAFHAGLTSVQQVVPSGPKLLDDPDLAAVLDLALHGSK
jgi:hypothetical protein